MAAVSYDPVAVLKDFADRRKITYPLLSDPDSSVIRRFGLVNPEYPPGHLAHGVPYPGSILVDENGIVRETYFEKTYPERRTAASILALQGDQPGGSVTETRRDHLTLQAAASSAEAAPGQRVTLILDFQMRDNHHAYAPGEHRYRPLTVRLDTQPSMTLHAPVLPAARPYLFKPLKETVPVFEGRFRILQDVTLATGGALAELLKQPDPALTITGTVEYQVCSEKVCYPPSSLPVSWTLKVRPLDRERPPEPLRRVPSRP